MCANFKNFKGAKDLKKLYKEINIDIGFDKKFSESDFDGLLEDNIRITDNILTIKLTENKPVFSIMSWSINWTPRQPIFNTRIETIRENKRWEDIFITSRCLIPASAFYEFRPMENDPPDAVLFKKKNKIKKKSKFEISIPDAPFFLIGGIYIINNEMEYCSMITTEPHKDLNKIPHNRCPYLIEYPNSIEFLQSDPGFLLDNIQHYPNEKQLEVKQFSEY